MISEERLQKALTYLAETDEECAERKADVARTEYVAKLREASAYKVADGKSVEDRKAQSRLDCSAQLAWDAHFSAIAAYEKLRAKRETESIVVDTWRSINANRRQGSV